MYQTAKLYSVSVAYSQDYFSSRKVLTVHRESDNSPKFSGGSHDPQSRTGLIDWALD